MRVITIILGDNGTNTLLDTEGKKVIVMFSDDEAQVSEYNHGTFLDTRWVHPDDAMSEATAYMGI